MKISGIYKIINKINGKYYIGSSISILKRFNAHLSYLRRNLHINLHLQNAWNSYGEINFEFIILEKIPNINKQELLKIEQNYLNIAETEQNKCYNLSFIANRPEMTGKTKEKIRQSQIKRLKLFNPLINRKCSEKTKQKISKTLIGKMIGDKNPWFGKKHSERTKSLISQKKQDKSIYKFFNKLTNETFIGTRKEFIKEYNFTRSHICKLIKKETKQTSCGWILV